jgi:hypothetical protein
MDSAARAVLNLLFPNETQLSAKFVADAGDSGITAMNLTVGEVGNGPSLFEKTLVQIPAA